MLIIYRDDNMCSRTASTLRSEEVKLSSGAFTFQRLTNYKKSIRKLIDDTGDKNWKVLYFYETQDQDIIDRQVKELRETLTMCQFVGIQGGLRDWEQLLAMTLCQHHIIANRTFSWWGAYLDEKQGCHVYYPAKWFATGCQKNTSNLFPEHWKRVYL